MKLALLSLVFAIGSSLAAQQSNPSQIEGLRQAGILEAPGAIPTFYVPTTKERALRFQKSLETASDWYEQQLHVRVPTILVIVDNGTRDKLVDRNPAPHTYLPGKNVPGIVVIPEPDRTANAMLGSDDDHKPGGLLQGEHTLFHEYGHLLADALRIQSGNAWVNELVPGMFLASYVAQARPDLGFVLEDRRKTSLPVQRYTSLADLDFVGPNMPLQNMPLQNTYWFQFHLERIADFLSQDQQLPSLVEKLKAEFPASSTQQESMEELNDRLSRLHVGFLEVAGPLAGPTTIASSNPVACDQLNSANEPPRPVTVLNQTGSPLTLTFSGAFDGFTPTLAPGRWITRNIPGGAKINLPDGSCVVPRVERTITIVRKP